MQRCLPQNITDIIDKAKEAGALEEIKKNAADSLDKLPFAVKYVQFLADFESVSLKESSFPSTFEANLYFHSAIIMQASVLSQIKKVE